MKLCHIKDDILKVFTGAIQCQKKIVLSRKGALSVVVICGPKEMMSFPILMNSSCC